MNALYDLFAYLTAIALQPLPAIALTVVPATISLAAAANLRSRDDDPISAWVQLITAMALTIWMGVPWHPNDEAALVLRSITLFTYVYVLQDWLREAWNTGYKPAWAHRIVVASFAFCGFAFYWTS